MPSYPARTLLITSVLFFTDVLSRPSDLVTKEVCLSQVELEWTHDTSADDYIITIAPPPATGLCANGTCSSDVDIVCDDDKCTFIVDSLEAIQYTYSVSSVNCAGIGQPSSTTEAVVAEGKSCVPDWNLFGELIW